jgi:outer membrane receptor protein involved in Fe transport
MFTVTAISTEPGTILELPDNTPGLDTMSHAVPYSVNNVNRTDRNLFPDVQLKYKFNEWSDLRLAYTTGIARPDYSAIIPKVAVYPFDHLDVGNPLLRPTTARNIDAILSVFSNKIGLLTINGFYKELKDVIYIPISTIEGS